MAVYEIPVLSAILAILAVINGQEVPSTPGFPNLPGFPDSTDRPGLPEFPGPGSSDNGQPPNQERFFFNQPSVTSCNYTTNPGRSCLSCTQALNCQASNIGLLRTCHGWLPYCNSGRCSHVQGEACSATTTSTTTTTTTAATGK